MAKRVYKGKGISPPAGSQKLDSLIVRMNGGVCEKILRELNPKI